MHGRSGDVRDPIYVANAFPTKLTAPDFDTASDEVAIEEIAFMGDSLKISFT